MEFGMITNEIMQKIEEVKEAIPLYAGDWIDDEVEVEVRDDEIFTFVEAEFKMWQRVVNLEFKIYHNSPYPIFILYGQDMEYEVLLNHAMFWRTVAMEMCDG